MSFGSAGGRDHSGMGQLGEVLQLLRSKDDELAKFRVDLERQQRRCQSIEGERKRAQEDLQKSTLAFSEQVREIKNLQGQVSDHKATIDRQAREQGSREALLAAANAKIKELQQNGQNASKEFAETLKRVNEAFRLRLLAAGRPADTAVDAAKSAAVNADEIIVLKKRVQEAEQRAQQAEIQQEKATADAQATAAALDELRKFNQELQAYCDDLEARLGIKEQQDGGDDGSGAQQQPQQDTDEQGTSKADHGTGTDATPITDDAMVV